MLSSIKPIQKSGNVTDISITTLFYYRIYSKVLMLSSIKPIQKSGNVLTYQLIPYFNSESLPNSSSQLSYVLLSHLLITSYMMVNITFALYVQYRYVI